MQKVRRKACLRLANELEKEKNMFFLGAGGVGMAALAHFCSSCGFQVSGVDRVENEYTRSLRAEGITVDIGDGEEIVLNHGVLVYSLAVPLTHSLFKQAKEKRMRICSRAELLGALMLRFPLRMVVCGMHGKSSTVGMCDAILCKAGITPTVLSGGRLDGVSGSCRVGKRTVLLLEGCEYKDSFLYLSPTHAAVLNAEWEHTDYFRDLWDVKDSFSAFLMAGSLQYSLLPQGEDWLSPRKGQRASFGPNGRFHAEQLSLGETGYRFELYEGEEHLGHVSLRTPGLFQVSNALAAAGLCRGIGVSGACIAEGLSHFGGTPRRMERVAFGEGQFLFLDYAHHPTELSAAIAAVEERGEKVALLFQPHTYARVSSFFSEYTSLLGRVMWAGVLPVFAAREENIPHIDSAALAKAAGAHLLLDAQHAAKAILEMADGNLRILLAGAGDVEKVLAFLPNVKREEK